MDPQNKEVSEKILNYLKKNPNASDTLEGICNWWLRLEKIEFSTNRVVQVLADLTKKGLLERIQNNDGTVFFRLKTRGKSSSAHK